MIRAISIISAFLFATASLCAQERIVTSAPETLRTSFCGNSSGPLARTREEAPSGKAVPVKTVKLYEDEAPVTENGLYGEVITPWGFIQKTGTADARFDLYLPEKENATGKMVIVCPGGAYSLVAATIEGSYAAEWLTDRGIAAVVLKYRLPNGHWTVPTEDFERTMRWCRAHSDELGVSIIGVMGFSAGGHFASTVATHLKGDNRPDFQILIYPVITMREGTHAGTRRNLIGQDAPEELMRLYSNEEQVSDTTPPAFIAIADDDTVVPPLLNGVAYYRALVTHRIPATMVSFPSGGHGWGFQPIGAKDNLAPESRASLYASLEVWLRGL